MIAIIHIDYTIYAYRHFPSILFYFFFIVIQ